MVSQKRNITSSFTQRRKKDGKNPLNTLLPKRVPKEQRSCAAQKKKLNLISETKQDLKSLCAQENQLVVNITVMLKIFANNING